MRHDACEVNPPDTTDVQVQILEQLKAIRWSLFVIIFLLCSIVFILFGGLD